MNTTQATDTKEAEGVKLSECLTEIRWQYKLRDDLFIDIIVRPYPDGVWVWLVRSQGGKDISGSACSQQAAEDAAREWCEGPEPYWA